MAVTTLDTNRKLVTATGGDTTANPPKPSKVTFSFPSPANALESFEVYAADGTTQITGVTVTNTGDNQWSATWNGITNGTEYIVIRRTPVDGEVDTATAIGSLADMSERLDRVNDNLERVSRAVQDTRKDLGYKVGAVPSDIDPLEKNNPVIEDGKSYYPTVEDGELEWKEDMTSVHRGEIDDLKAVQDDFNKAEAKAGTKDTIALTRRNNVEVDVKLTGIGENTTKIATNEDEIDAIKESIENGRLVPFYFTGILTEHTDGNGNISKRTSLQVQDNVSEADIGLNGGETRALVDLQYYHGSVKETNEYTDHNNHAHNIIVPGTVWLSRKFVNERDLEEGRRQYVLWLEVPYGTTHLDDATKTGRVSVDIRGFYPLATSEATGGGGVTDEELGEKIEEYIANSENNLTLDVPLKPTGISGTITDLAKNASHTVVLVPETKMLNRDGSVAYVKAGKLFITRYQSTSMVFDIAVPAQKRTDLKIEILAKHTFKNKAETATLYSFTHVKETNHTVDQNWRTPISLASFADSLSIVNVGDKVTDSGGTERTLTKEMIETTPTFFSLSMRITNTSVNQPNSARTIDYELTNPDIWFRQERNTVSLSPTGISDEDRAAIDSIASLEAKVESLEESPSTDFVLRRFFQYVPGSSVALKSGSDATYFVAHGAFLETVRVFLTIDGADGQYTFRSNPVEAHTGSVLSGGNWYYLDVYLPVDRPTTDGTVVETEPVQRVLGITEKGDKDKIASLESKVAGLLSGDSFDPDALHYVDRVPRHLERVTVTETNLGSPTTGTGGFFTSPSYDVFEGQIFKVVPGRLFNSIDAFCIVAKTPGTLVLEVETSFNAVTADVTNPTPIVLARIDNGAVVATGTSEMVVSGGTKSKATVTYTYTQSDVDNNLCLYPRTRNVRVSAASMRFSNLTINDGGTYRYHPPLQPHLPEKNLCGFPPLLRGKLYVARHPLLVQQPLSRKRGTSREQGLSARGVPMASHQEEGGDNRRGVLGWNGFLRGTFPRQPLRGQGESVASTPRNRSD